MRHYVWYADSSEMPFLPPGQDPNVWNGLDKTRCLLWKHTTRGGTGKESWEWGGRLPTPGEDLCIYRWVNKDSSHKKGISKASYHTHTFTYVHHVPRSGLDLSLYKTGPIKQHLCATLRTLPGIQQTHSESSASLLPSLWNTVARRKNSRARNVEASTATWMVERWNLKLCQVPSPFPAIATISGFLYATLLHPHPSAGRAKVDGAKRPVWEGTKGSERGVTCQRWINKAHEERPPSWLLNKSFRTDWLTRGMGKNFTF